MKAKENKLKKAAYLLYLLSEKSFLFTCLSNKEEIKETKNKILLNFREEMQDLAWHHAFKYMI